MDAGDITGIIKGDVEVKEVNVAIPVPFAVAIAKGIAQVTAQK